MARTLGLALGLAAAGLFLVAMTGCGSDSDDNSGGSGGTAGTGGSTGGTGGTGGSTGGTGGATGGTGGATGGTGGATGGTGGATGGTGGATGGTGGGGTGGGDNDNDCEHATDLSSGEGTGTIDPADDADFYSFPFTAGDWVIVRATVTGLPTDETLEDQPYEDILDTAVTIYDESGTQVATMDDSYPRPSVNGMNTELIWHVPADGTYCIKVEDWASWAGETRDPAATGTYFDYEIGLYSPNQTLDTEPNNDETEPQSQTYTELVDENDVGIGIFYSPLYGTLESATDVDVFQFTMPAGTVQLSTEDFTTPIGPGGVGTNGNGSTLQLGLVSISDTSGSIIAQLDASKGADAMNAPLEAGTDYLMWINRSGTTAGANDFYNLINYAWDQDNPREAETVAGTNDTAATAETITLTTSTTDPNMDSGYILGFIDGAGTDVDYYSFTAEAGDTVSVGCGALRSGSGLVGATFAINDTADAELQTETESDSEDIYWSDTTYGFETMSAVAIATTGTYYFVVSATSQNPNVSSNFYRCGIHVETP